jgi:II/X family phage/plasmid replication protein
MLDTLVIHVPMRQEFCVSVGNLHSVIGDVAHYQVRAVPSYFKRALDGTITHGDLFHPYESLPTSFGGMAMKFHAVNIANTLPYVSLNASVKILQGHNVCGGESVKNLACEMLGLLRSVYPEFFACLDVQNATISRLDSTFSARLDNEGLIAPCLRFLSNISNGHRKADTDKRDFYNTVYWGGATSRLGGCKVYGKHNEMMVEVNALREKVAKGYVASQRRLDLFTPDLIDWSRCLLRFESTTKRRKLEMLNIPTNLWQFIRHQGMDKDLLTRLWRLWFDPVFEAMKGDYELHNSNDVDVLARCRAVLWSQKKVALSLAPFVLSFPADFSNYRFAVSNPIKYTRANNAFNFYQLVRSQSFAVMKSRMSAYSFNYAIRSLVAVDFPRSVLQNLHDEKPITIPFRDLVQIDFTKQIPSWYTPVISSHINAFDVYIRKSGNINYQGGLKL